MESTNGTPQNNPVRIGTPKVHTLSVTIKALRIGSRQVTQSTFRQLPERAIAIACADTAPGTLTLRGTPWGHVNYFFGECKPNHLHVVWTDGGGVYRDCVYHPGTRLTGMAATYQAEVVHQELFLHTLAHYVIATRILGTGFLTLPDASMADRLCWSCGEESEISYFQVMASDYDAFNQLSQAVRGYREYAQEYQRRRVSLSLVERAWTQLERAASAMAVAEVYQRVLGRELPRTPAEATAAGDLLAQQLQHTRESQAYWHRLYAALYTQLAALDQLYIAV